MKRFFLAILVVIMLAATPAFARSSYYLTGDTIFSIRAGVSFPAFFSFYNDPDMGTVFFEETHATIGGDASLAYQGFISSYFALGGQIEYNFNYSVGGLLLTTVPLSVKLSFIPVQTGKFDLAFGLNLGGAFIRYNEGKYFAPYASLTINPSFYFTESWGIGIETGLMATAEIYTSSSDKHNQSAFAGLMPISLVLSYRH